MRLKLLKADVGKAGREHMTIDFRVIGKLYGATSDKANSTWRRKTAFFNVSSDGWTSNCSISSVNYTDF